MSPLSYRAAFLKSLVCSWAKTSPQFPTDITRMAQTDPVRKQDSDSDLADKGVHAAWYERFSEIKLGSWRMTPENRQIQLICNFGLGTKWKYFWKEKKKGLLHPAALFACLRKNPRRNKKFSANHKAFFSPHDNEKVAVRPGATWQLILERKKILAVIWYASCSSFFPFFFAVGNFLHLPRI